MPGPADRAAALAITQQGDGTWLLDDRGDPVAPAWLWLDGRSGPIVERWNQDGVGERVYRIAGTGLNTSQQSGHLAWLKRHRPEVLERAAVAMHCKGWLYYRCTGERVTDVSEGVFSFGDFRTRRSTPEVLEPLGLADLGRLLPPLMDGTEEHRPLTRDAAAATGLHEGTPVMLAPVDVLCTALGGGACEPGHPVGFTIIGSTAIHLRVYHSLEEIRLGERPSGYTVPIMAPGAWIRMRSNMAATLNIDRLLGLAEQVLETTGGEVPARRALIRVFDRLAGEAAPGGLLFHLDIMRARAEVNAIVHAHPIFSTTIAIMGRDIPAVHCMIAVSGGNSIRCAGYATYGTKELSENALAALEGRTACLLEHHGLIATGPDLAKATWLVVEIENLARQYFYTLQIGGPRILPDEEIARVLEGFKSYGLRPTSATGKRTKRAKATASA